MVKVLFVCLGNICRSPTAHGIFRELVRKENLENVIIIDSAGTGDWHIGKSPDKRAIKAAKQNGYDISDLRARQVTSEDFQQYDYILAMDNSNLNNLRSISPLNYSGELKLILDYHPDQPLREVPDPYYGENDGFVTVLTLIENASANLLEQIKNNCN
ncbi:MAG: low molecular weight phosphotyrosine protein phosphatase [Cellvibrionaceae bacterium]